MVFSVFYIYGFIHEIYLKFLQIAIMTNIVPLFLKKRIIAKYKTVRCRCLDLILVFIDLKCFCVLAVVFLEILE